MRLKTTITLAFLLCTQLLFSQQEPNTIEKTAEYFKEIKIICDKDNGSLWGISLWVPTLFIDYETRNLIANEQDFKEAYIPHGNVYTGKFPDNKIIANSTTELDGKKWVMVIAPLPEDSYVRNQLAIHEMFHYLQGELGLSPGKNYDNNHMDEMLARIYLKLEWSALNNALLSDKEADIQTALTDALVFRAYRRQLYPQADSMENRFEMQEGLAEYTGHKLCTNTREEFREQVLQSGKATWAKKSYVRSFGYHSGLAYAYLLDGCDWQKGLTPDTDLAQLVQKHYKILLPENIEQVQAEKRNSYGYSEIYDDELALKQKKDEIYAANKQKFVDGPIFAIPLQKPNVGFNPNNLQAFGDKGTVYPTMTVLDTWGMLKVSNGALLSGNWKLVTVSSVDMQINGTEIKGDGWELKLNEGYSVTKEGNSYMLSQ